MPLQSRKFLLRFEDAAIDPGLLLSEAEDPDGYIPFCDPLDNKPIAGWFMKVATSSHKMAEKVCEDYKKTFGLKDVRPRFYVQQPGHSVDFHQDRGTLCSFNFLLSGNLDPVTFADSKVRMSFAYKYALLNTQEFHAVLNPRAKRYLFKLSVFDKSYEEIASVLPTKLRGRQSPVEKVFHTELPSVQAPQDTQV